MLITDKVTLRNYLILTPTNELYLEFSNYYLNIYSISDTYIIKFVIIQSTKDIFNAIVKLDRKDNLVKLLKDLCTKTTSSIEFELEDNVLITKYKRTKKQVDDYICCTKLDNSNELIDLINNEVFTNELLLDLTTIEVVDTIYEYNPIFIDDQVIISSEDMNIVKRIFKENNLIVKYNNDYVLFYDVTTSTNFMCTRVFKV